MLALRRPAVSAIKWSRWQHSYSTQRYAHQPLRVLFCGADEFSIYSLRALHNLQQSDKQKIQSIDVVCRPDKRVGRGYKQLREVPIKRTTLDLDLNLHQIDTFTGWSPPHPIDLIVAVSFGLLVPSRILEAAKYGGLNVHPSLLPDLRGPAPIQHALLRRYTHTGVTVQTMHPREFDKGQILAQSPTPGVGIPDQANIGTMVDVLGPLGADMLSKVVENGVFTQRQESHRARNSDESTYAAKVTPEDKHIRWSEWTAEDIITRDRVLGRLWDNKTYGQVFHGGEQRAPKRILYQGPWTISDIEQVSVSESGRPQPGSVVLYDDAKVGLVTADGKIISPTAATIEGAPRDRGLDALRDEVRRTQHSDSIGK